MSDIQIAAEALQSLRASSASSSPVPPSSDLLEPVTHTSSHTSTSSYSPTLASHKPNSQLGNPDSLSIQLPPIGSQTDTFYSPQQSSKLGSKPFNHHYHHQQNQHRDSSYRSRSSSISSVVSGVTGSNLTVVDSSVFHSPISSPSHINKGLNTTDFTTIADSQASTSAPNSSKVTKSTGQDSKKRKRSIKSGFLNPIVVSAAKIYQQGKSYSPRFRQSAEKLESAISSRITINKSSPTVPTNEAIPGTSSGSTSTSNSSSSFSSSNSNLNSTFRTQEYSSDGEMRGSQSPTILPPISSLKSLTSSPSSSSSTQQQQDIPKPKKRQRSTWQGVLVTASSIATSLSYENKQRLRYCLHLLKLANTHIAAKVNQLQELLQEERAAAMAQSIAANHVPNNNNHTHNNTNDKNFKNRNHFLGQKVNTIKRDIVFTIRKVISALSTYAGNSLPEPARSHVRNYILRLPARWASSLAPSNAGSGTSTGYGTGYSTGYSTPVLGPSSTVGTSAPNTPTIKSMLSPTPDHEESLNGLQTESTLNQSVPGSPSSVPPSSSSSNSNNNSHHSDAEIGNRVLSLATEALDMLGSIISIVDETLEKAEVWCDRFGRVGINTRGPPSREKESEKGELGSGNGNENGIKIENEIDNSNGNMLNSDTLRQRTAFSESKSEQS